MPNVFSNSLDQLGQWLNSPDGQQAFTIQPNTPLTTGPDLVRPPAAQNPQGRTLFGMVPRPIQYPPISSQGMPYTPGGQSGMAVKAGDPNVPYMAGTDPYSYEAQQYANRTPYPEIRSEGAPYTPGEQSAGVPTMTPTGDVGGRTNLPTHVIEPYRPTMTPTGDVRGGGPTGTIQQPWGRPMGGPAPYVSPTNQAAQAAQSRGAGQPSSGQPAPPTKVTTKIDRPTHSETHVVQAKTPDQGGKGGTGGQGAPSQGDMFNTVADLLTGQTGTGGERALSGGAPSGPAPATGPPAGGQNVNLQVPAHPGLLQRIGQTIGHFFSGTLGQYQQPPGQYTGTPVQNQTGGSALSGISRALASGRQHVATHGRSSPASAPTPTLAYTDQGYSASAAMPRQGQTVPYVPESTSPPPTGYVSGEGTTAGGPKPTPGFTFRGQDGKLYQADPQNPGQYVRIQ